MQCPDHQFFLFIVFHGSSLASVEFMANNGMLYDLMNGLNEDATERCLSYWINVCTSVKVNEYIVFGANVSPIFFQHLVVVWGLILAK